jgi:hypothetical protein
MDQLQTRLDALEQQMHTVTRRLRWWRGLAGGLLVLAVLTWALPAGTAQEGASTEGEKDKKGLEQRVAALEDLLKHFSREDNEVFLTGANLHIRNGLGRTECGELGGEPITDCPNGLGNLIVGYNELRRPPVIEDESKAASSENLNVRTGSHNVVVGAEHNFSRFGGLVVGLRNEISGDFASVSGGVNNTASGFFAAASGGLFNTASGESSVVSGGEANTASGFLSVVSGGSSNAASGANSVVIGGNVNTASGEGAVVSGGSGNMANGVFFATVSGGASNRASGDSAVVSGGVENTASGSFTSVSGGVQNTASGELGASVSGGSQNTASGFVTVVSGGRENTASGGDPEIGTSGAAVVSGGFQNTASGDSAVVSGGRNRTAEGEFDWVAGSLVEDE